MNKEQCEAICKTVSISAKHTSDTIARFLRGKSSFTALQEMNEQLERDIEDIIKDIPDGGGGGGGITVDSELSDTSMNPVQNAVLTQALNEVSSSVTSLDAAVKNMSANLQFVAEYNVTTAQEIATHIDRGYSKTIVVKRGNDFYTAILAQKTSDSKVILRCIGSMSNEFYIFTYTVTNGTWASATHGLQPKLVSGTNIKTINKNSILGEGDLQL